MRLQQSLAGSWQFQLDPEGTVRLENLKPDRSIQVPMPWQAEMPELEHYSGYAWYQREVELDASWLSGEVLLTFGSVDYWCEVFVNGQLVGQHEGGYTAFRFPIRPFLKAGKNQIAVRVYDAVYEGQLLPRWYDDESTDKLFNPLHIPHGKQSWYIDASGLWQDVTLTAVPSLYIDQIRITPDIHAGSASISIDLAGDLAQATGTVNVSVGAAQVAAQLTAGQAHVDLTVTVDNPQLWTPETPNLYTAEITLASQAGEDSQSVRFGLRDIAVKEGRLLLNGEPIFLLSALDQDMYHRTIYTVPSEEYLRDEFTKAKELGLNCLRCHIKPPDPLYLDLADEMGLLVWAEIPSWRTFYARSTLNNERFNVTDDIKARASQTLREMIARDFNHPSIVIWTIVNEDWGTAVQMSKNDRAWLAQMYDECKALDATRLVVDNSACLTNLHVKSDLDDYHVYTNIPDAAKFFEDFLENFSRRAAWSYTNHGDAQRTGHEALILSEFGNWGLPSVEALREPDGSLPDWFKLGPWWSAWEGEPGWPRGVLERFQSFGLTSIWPDYEAFAQASQWHQYHAMKYELEVMRRQPALAGYVITELSDIYWESNGLMDFNRGKKVYHDIFAAINTSDVIIPRVQRYAVWDDESLLLQLAGSRYSGNDWSDVTLNVSLNGQTTQKALPALARGEVADWGVQELHVAKTAETAHQKVTFSADRASGETLAHNDIDILVLPAATRDASYTGSLVVPAVTPDPLNPGKDAGAAAVAALQKIGYVVDRDLSAGLIVTDNATEAVLENVYNGGKLLYFSTGIGPFFWRQDRNGVYSGNWMGCFSWLRPEVFPRLGIANPLTLPYASVIASGVLLGLPVDDPAVQKDFLGGQVTGWIGHPAVHMVQFRYGKGTVIISTHPLLAALNHETPDPVAIAMMHDLVDYLASDRCQPTLTTNISSINLHA